MGSTKQASLTDTPGASATKQRSGTTMVSLMPPSSPTPIMPGGASPAQVVVPALAAIALAADHQRLHGHRRSIGEFPRHFVAQGDLGSEDRIQQVEIRAANARRPEFHPNALPFRLG